MVIRKPGSIHASLLCRSCFPLSHLVSLVAFFFFSPSTPLSLLSSSSRLCSFSLSYFILSTFHFSSLFLFFSLKKHKSLFLYYLTFFPWFPLPHPSFYYSLCLLPPRLPSPPGPHPPLSFAHGEITADKRAPPCPTVLHEALWNLVLGSLASPPSLLGGVP